MPALGPPVSQRTATRRRRREYEKREATLRRPPPTPRREPRPAPTRPTTKIGQQVAREQAQEKAQKKAARARARVPKRPTPLRATPRVPLGRAPRLAAELPDAPVQRALAQERGYKSQGRAIGAQADRANLTRQLVKTLGRKAPAPKGATVKPAPKLVTTHTHAITDPALEEITAYVNKPVAQRRALLKQIKAKPVNQQTLGEYNILRIHRGRHNADVKMMKTSRFLPRVRYGYTPKQTKYNVMPRTQEQREKDALKAKIAARTYAPKATPAQRAALVGRISTPQGLAGFKLTQQQKQARHLAPALTALEQVSRPVYGVAGGARALVKGENVVKGATRGLSLKDKYLFSDVLEAAGVDNKAIRALVGLPLDVLLDPTTYVGFGLTTVAKKSLMRAAEQAAIQARHATERGLAGKLAAGELTKREVKLQGRLAAVKARTGAIDKGRKEGALEGTRGITFKVAGGRTAKRAGRAVRRALIGRDAEAKLAAKLPTAAPLTRTTARVGKTAKAVGGSLPGGKRVGTMGRSLRKAGSELQPQIAPTDVTRGEHERGREILRGQRSTETSLKRKGAARAQSYSVLLSEEEGHIIRQAIERGQEGIDALKGMAPKIKVGLRHRGLREMAKDPDRLHKLAQFASDDWGAYRQRLVEAGVPVGWVGVKPKVAIPEATANVPAARQALSSSRSQLARAEREALEQAKPGALPGRLTPAQTTRAGRLAEQGRQAKAKALDDFKRAKRIEASASNPAIKKRMVQRARAARGRMARAQQQIDHWSHVAGRETRPTRRVLAPEERISVTEANRAENAPNVHQLTSHLPETGKPGIHREQGIDRQAYEFSQGREKLPRSDVHVFTMRDADGKILGALEAYAPYPKTDAAGEIVKRNGKTVWDVRTSSVAVDPAHRRQGIASKLMQRAEDEGINVLRPSGEKYTQEGAALLNRLRGALAEKAPLEATSKAAPPRGAIPAAQDRVKALERALTQEKNLGRVERRTIRRAEKLAARREGEAQGYFPRYPRERLEERGRLLEFDEVAPTRRGAASVPGKKTRKYVQPIEALERGTETQRRHAAAQAANVGQVSQAYTAGFAREIGRAEAIRDVAQEGRPLVAGRASDLSDRDAVYRYEDGNLHKLDAKRSKDLGELHALETNPEHPGTYVALPERWADHMVEQIRSQQTTTSHAGQQWERFWGGWRKAALGTPAYLGRNAASDLFAAYGAQNPAKLAFNYFRGIKTLNALGREEKAYRAFQDVMEKEGRGTGTTVNGVPISYRDLAFEAEAAGAIRQGRVREIMEQRELGKGARLSRPKGTGAWQKAVQRVEDSTRIATYIGYRRRGFTPEQSAAKVAKIHFDYGELTRLEKGARRAAPFYTFTARNIPRQLELLATRPGKLANYEKLRQESMRAIQDDLNKDWEAGLDPYEARQLGIPVKLGGKTFTVSWGLPFSDLNDVVPADPRKAGDWAKLLFVTPTRRGLELVGPFKAIPELIYNYSLFYRDEIDNADAPTTPVPAQIAALADRSPSFRKLAGIHDEKIVNKQTGEREWAWPKRVDYAVRQMMPGALGAAWRMGYQSQTARGFGPTEEIVGSLTGIRAKPMDRVQNELNRLYDEREEIKPEVARLHQAAINKAYPTPALERKTARLSAVEARISDLESGRNVFYKGRWQKKDQRVAGALLSGGAPLKSGAALKGGASLLKAR